MGIPFTILMGFLLTMTMGILFTITIGIQLTIYRDISKRDFGRWVIVLSLYLRSCWRWGIKEVMRRSRDIFVPCGRRPTEKPRFDLRHLQADSPRLTGARGSVGGEAPKNSSFCTDSRL